LEYSPNKHLRSSATTRQAHFYAVRYRQLVVPPTHAVGDVFPSAARRTDGRPSLRVATRRRCDNNAVACRCDRVVPPPVVQTAGHCSPRHPPTPRQCRRRRLPGDHYLSPGRAGAASAAYRTSPPDRRDDRWSPPRAHSATASHVTRALVGTAPATPSHGVAARHCTPVRAALSALQRARRRSPPVVT